MVWETEPRYVIGILLLRVARSAVPLAVLWIGKLIVDEVVHAINLHNSGGPLPWSRLAFLVGIELAIALAGEGLSRVSALLESLLGDLFANRTSVQLMQHAATLDLEQFENAEIYDKLERARRPRGWPGGCRRRSCTRRRGVVCLRPIERRRPRSCPTAGCRGRHRQTAQRGTPRWARADRCARGRVWGPGYCRGVRPV
jgi:hypothetical protein